MMLWVKALHILMIAAWLTGSFVAPRGLIYAKREYETLGTTGNAFELTFRIYRFSAFMALIAIITGLWLATPWFGDIWLWIKIALVACLAAHYIYTGRMLKKLRYGQLQVSDLFLRIFNEVSVLLAFSIIALVLFKP